MPGDDRDTTTMEVNEALARRVRAYAMNEGIRVLDANNAAFEAFLEDRDTSPGSDETEKDQIPTKEVN